MEVVAGVAARATVVLLKNRVFLCAVPGVSTLDILDCDTRPVGGWAWRYLWAVYRHRARIRAEVARGGGGALLLFYGSCNALAGWMLQRICPMVVVFDPRENLVATLPLLRRARGGVRHKVWCTLQIIKERCYEALLGDYVHHWLFQSDHDARSHQRRLGFLEGDFSVVANGPPRGRLSAAVRASNRCTHDTVREILFCGSLTVAKGIWEMVEAVCAISDDCPALRLHIAGSGAEEGALRGYIAAHHLSERVEMHGQVENPLPLMQRCDLLVVPSYYESQPDVVLEALWVGIPVIGSDVSGVVYYLRHPELLFAARSVSEIAQRVLSLSQDATLYATVRTLCGQRAGVIDWERDWSQDVWRVLQRVERDSLKVRAT